jgi:hypothetical protein
VNLAAWKYRNILTVDGGPVQNISTRPIVTNDALVGYESFAFLEPKNRKNFESGYSLYGSADGCGFGPNKSISVYKAISESIERWAYYDCITDCSSGKYGFDVDSSTTGMAAFPGLTPRSVRNAAYHEAIERWAVSEWWEGYLPMRTVAENVYSISTPFAESQTLIIKRSVEISGKCYSCFGFASDINRGLALGRAMVELNRNIFNLRNFINLKHVSRELYERRLLYFASTGLQKFNSRVASAHSMKVVPKRPKLLVDKMIDGEWSKYAWVWRCLFEKKNGYNGNDLEYFLF